MSCRILMNRKLLLYALGALLSIPSVCHSQAPLSMKDAVRFALSHRPELRADDDRVNAAAHLQSQAKLIPNAHFLFRKEDLRPETSPFGENSQTYWEGEQLLEISGKRGGRIDVADQTVKGRRLQLELDRRQIALSVRESYWRARAIEALSGLYEEDARYFEQIVDYHDARFKEGKIAEVDLLRVRLQGQQIKAAAASAKLNAEKALLVLAQEMNAAPDAAWVLSDDLETLEEPRVLPVGSDAATLRTEGQVAEQAIAQAQAQTKLERANGRPDLLFTGGYKRDVQLDSPIAGVQFDLPLFNRNQGGVAAAKANAEAA